jgi:hypothetical protein
VSHCRATKEVVHMLSSFKSKAPEKEKDKNAVGKCS